MKKPEIAKRMARQSGVSQAEAADRLDQVVHRILSNLRKGKETDVPGLGKFVIRSGWQLSRLEREHGTEP